MFRAVSSRATLGKRWKQGQRGWPASFPVAQLPNAPLLVALTGWSVAELAEGRAHSIARAVFLAGLAAWAWGELASGSNWVRRGMGVGGFAYVIAALSAAPGASG